MFSADAPQAMHTGTVERIVTIASGQFKEMSEITKVYYHLGESLMPFRPSDRYAGQVLSALA